MMASHAGASDGFATQSLIATRPRGRRAMIAAACFTATLSAALIYDVLPPIMSDLSRHFGDDEAGRFVAQLAGTLPLFGVMVAGLVAGPLIERMGLRPLLLIAMALFGLAGSAGVAIDTPAPFLAARLLMGVAAGLMTTACTSLVAIFFQGAAQARMNGLVVSAGSFGGIVFVLIAGWAAGWWWRAPFLLHGAVVLAFLLPVLLTGPVPEPAPLAAGPMGNLRRLRPMLPVLAAGFAWFAIMLMSTVQVPFVLAAAGLGQHNVIAALFALSAGSVMVGSLLFGQVAARFDPVAVLRLSFLAMAAGMVAVGAAGSLWQFAIGQAIHGASIGVGLTALWTWGMRRAPGDLIARSLGAMTTFLYLGGALSPFLTAPYLRLGVRGQFFGVAATVALVVALVWLAGRGRRAAHRAPRERASRSPIVSGPAPGRRSAVPRPPRG